MQLQLLKSLVAFCLFVVPAIAVYQNVLSNNPYGGETFEAARQDLSDLAGSDTTQDKPSDTALLAAMLEYTGLDRKYWPDKSRKQYESRCINIKGRRICPPGAKRGCSPAMNSQLCDMNQYNQAVDTEQSEAWQQVG